MEFFNGFFAFVQATFPILAALPSIIISLDPPIPLSKVLNFYYILLVYFIIVAILGLFGIMIGDGPANLKSLVAFTYILITFLSVVLSYRIAAWTLTSHVSRLTGWAKKLSEINRKSTIHNGRSKSSTAKTKTKKARIKT